MTSPHCILVAALLCVIIGCARPTPPRAVEPPDFSSVQDPAPNIRLPEGPTGAFEIVGLGTEELEALCAVEEPASVFAVYVDPGPKADLRSVPPMTGEYRTRDGKLCFEPRYPLTLGLRYRVVFDAGAIPGVKAGTKKQEKTLEFPKPAAPATTVVAAVYPSRDQLPENQLRFYLRFSAPMSRGEAYEHIKLLDSAGKPIESAFLELGEELWDPTGTRFTLLIDPGRIKRGLKPREDLGPVLEAGKSYTLVIDRHWTDAEGNPLKESFRKTFSAGPPDEQPIEPKDWKLQSPTAGTSSPLVVTFPEPLDHGMLHRLLWVAGSKGERLAGTVKVTDRESRWHFTPAQPWEPGDYHLVVDTSLEDLAGNRVGELFEVDVFKPIERRIETKTVQISFSITR